MLLFPFNQSPRRDSKILNDRLSFCFLMTIGVDYLFFEFRTIGPSFPINCKGRLARSTEKSLRIISPMPMLSGFCAFALDAGSHQHKKNKNQIFIYVSILK